MKKALTMIELIVVIVILGILSAGSMNIFMQVYNNYNITKRVTHLESKTSAILDTLNAKLRKRFAEGVRYRCSNTDNTTKYLRDVKSTDTICVGHEPQVLEWVVNYDQKYLKKDLANDVKSKFCFSGVVDMTKTMQSYVQNAAITHNAIKIYDADEIHTKANCFKANEKVGVYFLDTVYNKNFIEDVLVSGTINNDNSISILLNDNKTKRANVIVSTAYQIAKSAQAFSVEEPQELKPNANNTNKVKLYKMYLYYDYQPWVTNMDKTLSALHTSNNAKKVLIAENISQFRTIQYGDAIGIDICIDDPSYKVKDSKGNYKFLRVCKIGGAI